LIYAQQRHAKQIPGGIGTGSFSALEKEVQMRNDSVQERSLAGEIELTAVLTAGIFGGSLALSHFGQSSAAQFGATLLNDLMLFIIPLTAGAAPLVWISRLGCRGAWRHRSLTLNLRPNPQQLFSFFQASHLQAEFPQR
jgi:hypothetical protein